MYVTQRQTDDRQRLMPMMPYGKRNVTRLVMLY